MDLSSFPLLRLDEINLHDTITLEKSMEALVSLIDYKRQSLDATLVAYSKKLIELIRREIAIRRVDSLLKPNVNINSDVIINPRDVLSQGKTVPEVTTKDSQTLTQSTRASSTHKDINKTEQSSAVIVMHTESGNSAKKKLEEYSDAKKEDMFMVSYRSNSDNKAGGFRARARKADAVIKLKKHYASEKYKQQMAENAKRSKRMMVIKRIDKRNKEKLEKIQQIKKQKKVQRRIREEEWKRNNEAVRDEMELVVSTAKTLTTLKGGTEEEGNILAAAAATEVMNKANIDIADSDSTSSFLSDVDHSSYTEYQESDHCLSPPPVAALVLEEDLKNADSELIHYSLPEILHECPNVDNAHTKELFIDEKLNIITSGRKSEHDHNIDVVEYEHHTTNEQPVYKLGVPEYEDIVNKETFMTEDISSIKDISCTESTNAYQVINTTNRENDSISFCRINDDCNSNLFHHTASTKNLVGDLSSPSPPNQFHEIIMQTQNKSKKCIHAESKKYTQSSPLFTDIFPHFHNIFSVFSGTKSYRKHDNNDICSFRECLEYQIKLNTVVLKKTTDSLPDLSDKTWPSISSGQSNSSLVGQSRLLYTINSPKPEISSIISEVIESYEVGHEWENIRKEKGLGNCWNLLWTWKKIKPNLEHLLVCQKISRFQHASFLTRKDYLKKQLLKSSSMTCLNNDMSLLSPVNIGKINAHFPGTSFSDIMPPTYSLPCEYNAFVAEFSFAQNQLENKTLNVWIMKPIGMSRGRGISLINDIGSVLYSSPTVIQKYVMNPLLFRGFKFDLRLYVTVTSFNPLEAFIYREGLARFSFSKFSRTCMNDINIHLTNSSIQQNYRNEAGSSHPVRLAGENGGGNKVKMTWLWKRLKEQGIDTILLWNNITNLCLRTLLSVNDDIPFQPNAFEVFGFDVLIDDMLKPWLIEVNSCPSLARDSNLDILVKEGLIRDTINLLNPAEFDRTQLLHICQRRLFQKKKKASHCNLDDKEQLEEDLKNIFKNKLPRQYGDPIPVGMKDYEYLAPESYLTPS